MRKITDTYFVSPQINPEDLPALKEAGITMIINNRPDMEIPPSHQGAAMEEAAKACGLPIAHLPITHDSMTPEAIAQQRALMAEADGPVLAYCASGTRCTVIWALGEAGARPADDIISTAAEAGYDLSPLRGRLG